MLLSLEGIRLVERDLVTKSRQRLEQAAIIGGGAVPVGGDQARSEECNSHGITACRAGSADSACSGLCLPLRDLTIDNSASTRWAQVWRARIAFRPLSTRPRARLWSERIDAMACAISSSSSAIKWLSAGNSCSSSDQGEHTS